MKKYKIAGIIALVFVVGLSVIGVKASDNRNINDLVELAGVVNESNSDVVMAAMNFLSEGMFGASGTRFPHGISADNTSPLEGEVRGTTLTTTGAVAIGGRLTEGGAILASSTAGAADTITEAQLIAYSQIDYTPGDAAVTLTLPATSTLTTLIPNAGDKVTFKIRNLDATAATSTTIAAGTGMDLVENENGDVVIEGGNEAYIRLIRESDTDVTVSVDEYAAAD